MPEQVYIAQVRIVLESGERLLLQKTCASEEDATAAKNWVVSSFDALETDDVWEISDLDDSAVVRVGRDNIASMTVGIYS